MIFNFIVKYLFYLIFLYNIICKVIVPNTNYDHKELNIRDNEEGIQSKDSFELNEYVVRMENETPSSFLKRVKRKNKKKRKSKRKSNSKKLKKGNRKKKNKKRRTRKNKRKKNKKNENKNNANNNNQEEEDYYGGEASYGGNYDYGDYYDDNN
uniref:Uncharacterized protein n=1 Tax=Parastrongyloides trichosuri TaxID=131310 RepID=A0A0N5A3A1_PARTI